MILALALGRIGFFGQPGPLWALLGFICCVVVVAILFKILFLALPALGVTEPWISIIFWLCVLVVFIAFINFAFGFGWAG
jgi:hypothetical protein